MTLSEIKTALKSLDKISFTLPNGELVPAHFHVTEVGKVIKDFIDCGGWEENDYDHRLHPEKLLNIIEMSEKVLEIGDLPIEVEYQGDTICKYNVELSGDTFNLVSTKTACLAMDACGVPAEKVKVNLGDLTAGSCCTPDGGCC